MTHNESQRRNLNVGIGEFYRQSLPPIDFGRIAHKLQSKLFLRKLEKERQRQFQEYKDRVVKLLVEQ